MCLCHKATARWDSGSWKRKVFQINTLEHRMGTDAKESSPQSKKKKKGIDSFCGESNAS